MATNTAQTEPLSVEEFLDTIRPPAWMAKAACIGHANVTWFPPNRRSREARAAKRICAVCPVRSECLEWGLDQGWELDGIWGGTTQGARRQLLRNRRKGVGDEHPKTAEVRPAVATILPLLSEALSGAAPTVETVEGAAEKVAKGETTSPAPCSTLTPLAVEPLKPHPSVHVTMRALEQMIG